MGVPVRRDQQDRRGLAARRRLDRGAATSTSSSTRRRARARAPTARRSAAPRSPAASRASRRCRAALAAARAIARGARGEAEVLSLQELHGTREPRGGRCECSRRSAARARSSRRTTSAPTVVLAVHDPDGPAPAAGAVLHAGRGRALGRGRGERPFLPRAFSYLRAARRRGSSSCSRTSGRAPTGYASCAPATGCGSPVRSGRLRPPERRRALLVRRRHRHRAAARCWQDTLGGRATVLLGFRDARHAEAAALLIAATSTLATDDGSAGHHGLVTELLADELTATGVDRLRLRPAADARGACARCAPSAACPPSSRSSRAWRAASAPASAASCRTRDGLRARVRRRPGARRRPSSRRCRRIELDFCGIALEHPVINGSGTFDAIAARRAFGDALLERFPFSAFVSKTITCEPRAGNPPPRLWETAGGMINSIGLPNKGLPATSSTTCRSWPSCRCR